MSIKSDTSVNVKLVGMLNGVSATVKTDELMAARQLYQCNRLFLKASEYCDAMYDEWYILSGFHGLLRPTDLIRGHDRDMRYMTMNERRVWRDGVVDRMRGLGLLKAGHFIMWHAARPYVELLSDLWPEDMQCAPVAGLGLGAQMHWYVHKGF